MYNFDDPKYFTFDSILNHKNIKIFEDIQKESLKYNLTKNGPLTMNIKNLRTLENKTVSFIPLGIYYENNQYFKWIPNVLDQIITPPLRKMIYDEFHYSKELLDEVFNNEIVNLELKYKKAIPFMIGLFHKYNVIEFEDPNEKNIKSYILVDLGIETNEDTFNKIRNDIHNTQLLGEFIRIDKQKEINK